jgi:hypothetical protein
LTEIVADYARAGSEISNSIKEISGIEKRTFDLMFAIQYQMGKDKKVHFSKFRKRVSDKLITPNIGPVTLKCLQDHLRHI